jgi:8-oxo-dGTP pyrophosphatase MutT (NUDIX family)
MKQFKTLYAGDRFDVVDVKGQIGCKNKEMSVGVLPYNVDEHGMVSEIGLLKELNHFREGDYCDTIITGTIEYEDDSLLLTAIRELKEEGGFELPADSNDRWLFLGPIYLYKNSDQIVPVFAVDVTGIEQKEAVGDGTDKEELSRLHMVPVSNGISSDEGIVLASFLRLFNYMYGKATGNI